MSRTIGTVSRGVRAPIIREGDNIVEIVTTSILEASKDAGFEIKDRDIVAMTEAIVARAQGNYASVNDIATDVSNKFGKDAILKGMNLEENGTTRERNHQIGGHRSGS